MAKTWRTSAAVMRTYDNTAAYAVGEIQALKYWARAEPALIKALLYHLEL